MMRGFLADRGYTGAEAEKKMKDGFADDPQMKKAFDNFSCITYTLWPEPT